MLQAILRELSLFWSVAKVTLVFVVPGYIAIMSVLFALKVCRVPFMLTVLLAGVSFLVPGFLYVYVREKYCGGNVKEGVLD